MAESLRDSAEKVPKLAESVRSLAEYLRKLAESRTKMAESLGREPAEYRPVYRNGARLKKVNKRGLAESSGNSAEKVPKLAESVRS